jgi:hypothetical protein
MSDNRTVSPGGCLGNVLIWIGIVWLVFAGFAGFGLMRESGSSAPIGFMIGSLVPATIFILVGRAFKKGSQTGSGTVVGRPPTAAPPARQAPPQPAPPRAQPAPAPVEPLPSLDADDIHEDRFAETLADAMDDPLDPEPGVQPEYESSLEMGDRPLTSEEMIEEAKRRLDMDDEG